MTTIDSRTSDLLLSYIEHIEKLEKEKSDIQTDIKEVKAQAKAHGFDTKIINQLIRLRKMDEFDRLEYENLLGIYKRAIGMASFYDTPLGKTSPKPEGGPKPEDKPKQEPKPEPKIIRPGTSGSMPAPKPDYPEDATEATAHKMGADAAKAGQAITTNPFPPRDSRRLAWDQAWCRETDTDGMEIPESLRRKKSRKEPDNPPDKPAAESPKPATGKKQNPKGPDSK